MSEFLEVLGLKAVPQLLPSSTRQWAVGCFGRVEQFFSRTYERDMQDLNIIMNAIEWTAVHIFGCEKSTHS